MIVLIKEIVLIQLILSKEIFKHQRLYKIKILIKGINRQINNYNINNILRLWTIMPKNKLILSFKMTNRNDRGF